LKREPALLAWLFCYCAFFGAVLVGHTTTEPTQELSKYIRRPLRRTTNGFASRPPETRFLVPVLQPAD
jgi:hypothetical protein